MSWYTHHQGQGDTHTYTSDMVFFFGQGGAHTFTARMHESHLITHNLILLVIAFTSVEDTHLLYTHFQQAPYVGAFDR